MTRVATAEPAGEDTATPQRTGDSTLGAALGGYWHHSELPLASLLFLLPLVVAYEVGTRFLTEGALQGKEQQIIAFLLLRQFFGWCGAHGRFLPAAALFGILLAWHILRRDPWVVRLETLAGMALESVLLAFPVLVMGLALARYFPLQATTGRSGEAVILALGAGVYEELVFRLILITLLSLILRDAFQMGAASAGVLMVVTSALLFSAYHYLSPYEEFHAQTFTFRTLAGVYFGVLFLTRGFGITAASHAAYDVLIVSLAAVQT